VAVKPRVLGIRTAASSRHFRIESVHLRFSNGAEREFERITSSSVVGAVVVVAMRDPSTVLLVREYAVGIERYDLHLPMGNIEPGESVIEAASRELAEETGFGARQLERLHSLTIAPGIFGYQAEIVLARGLFPRRLSGDEPEPLDLVDFPLAQLDSPDGLARISEARTLAALFIARTRSAQWTSD
jgi:ADP-ribose diphosphatase